MTKEHDLIARHFAPLCSGPDDAPAFGLLDDAALLEGHLLVTMDALVAGVHFFFDDHPGDIAVKALAVNVSDIVAKGGRPSLYLMTLALPDDLPPGWLHMFSGTLKLAQEQYGCRLIGGDTVSTSGPLTISITLIGEVQTGKMVRRKGAAPGDLIYVSGTIGDAALGLLVRQNDERLKEGLSAGQHDDLIDRYLHPRPPLELASPIARHASAAMDISDGLAGDFAKLCAASSVGGVIEAARLPLSTAATRALAQSPDLFDTVLTGGDDYQVLATVPRDKAAVFERQAGGVTRIGEIVVADKGVSVLDEHGQVMELTDGAYDHFADEEA